MSGLLSLVTGAKAIYYQPSKPNEYNTLHAQGPELMGGSHTQFWFQVL